MAPPATAAPTGCYKCGRPGHWSRDCPSSSSSSGAASNLPSQPKASVSSSGGGRGGGTWKPSESSSSSWKKLAPKAAPTKPLLPRKRPKLTPDLLLSNDGLGYVLEHFPRMVKIQGPGHEVDDLKSFLEAYVHWHSRILPYFSFNQFVEKVAKVGSMKRVRMCLNDLKNKVARGDGLKLIGEEKPDRAEGDKNLSFDDNVPTNEGASGPLEEPHDDDDDEDALPTEINEDVFDEFYKQAVEEPCNNHPAPSSAMESTTSVAENATGKSTQSTAPVSCNSISEDQKLRMESNRLKALERSKARAAATEVASPFQS